MSFAPASKWQRKVARLGIDHERLGELEIVSPRHGQVIQARLFPPWFADDEAQGWDFLPCCQHTWPPFETLVRISALCSELTHESLIKKRAKCPACAAGIERRKEGLVFALLDSGGTVLIKLPLRFIKMVVADGCFSPSSGRKVAINCDKYGHLRVDLLEESPIDEAQARAEIDMLDLRVNRLDLREDLLEDMVDAQTGWLKAGSPLPIPDQHRDLADHLPNCIFVPIPWGFKGPHDLGWNSVNLDDAHDYDYLRRLDGGNIGLLCGKNRVIIVVGLDADDERLHQGLLRCNPWLADTFAVEGRPGRIKWFFTVTGDGAEKCLHSTKIFRRAVTGEEIEVGDWLASGKQGVVWGLHPCGVWYRPNWRPLVNIDAAQFSLPTGYDMRVRGEEPLESAQEQYRRAKYGERPAPDMELVLSALKRIDPDERGTWFKVGCALKNLGQRTGDLDGARKIFDAWASESTKFDEGGQEKLWSSIGANGSRSITVGSIFHMAKENEWDYDQA